MKTNKINGLTGETPLDGIISVFQPLFYGLFDAKRHHATRNATNKNNNLAIETPLDDKTPQKKPPRCTCGGVWGLAFRTPP